MRLLYIPKPVLKIGDAYGGGIIAYLRLPGESGYDATMPHGLIVAPESQYLGSSGTTGWWNGSYVDTYTGTSPQTDMGYGEVNTMMINSLQGAGTYAAQICQDLVLNGYDDWFLPNLAEMEYVWNNRVAIGGDITANVYYWLSNEWSDDNRFAWAKFWGTTANNWFLGNWNLGASRSGPRVKIDKSVTWVYVRAVRIF